MNRRNIGFCVSAIFVALVVAPLSDTAQARSQVGPPRPAVKIEFTSDAFKAAEFNDVQRYGLPDGAITFLREHDSIRVWMPTGDGGNSIELQTDDLHHFRSSVTPAPWVLSPIAGSWESNYTGISKVLRLPSGQLVALYQAEEHPCGGQVAGVSIAMATSDDDGVTWSRRGQILTSPAITKTSCDDMVFHGNYSFSATVEPTGQYVYLWFSQGSDESWDDGLGGLRIARAPLSSGLLPGTWEKWYQGNWTQPGLGGRASQTLATPTPQWSPDPEISNEFAAIPSVTWNTAFNIYIAVFTTMTGFWYATSPDGMRWSDGEQLLKHKVFISSNRSPDEAWVYYPTLIDPTALTDGYSSTTGLLFYAFTPTGFAHEMMGREVKISSVAPSLPATGAKPNFVLYISFVLMAMGLATSCYRKVLPLRNYSS